MTSRIVLGTPKYVPKRAIIKHEQQFNFFPQIEYDDRARITKITAADTVAPPKPAAPAAVKAQNGEEEDDLDIDAI